MKQLPQEMLNGDDLAAYLRHDAHRFVAQHVPGFEERAEHLVEMQV